MILVFKIPVATTAKQFGVEYAELYHDGEIAVWRMPFVSVCNLAREERRNRSNVKKLKAVPPNMRSVAWHFFK